MENKDKKITLAKAIKQARSAYEPSQDVVEAIKTKVFRHQTNQEGVFNWQYPVYYLAGFAAVVFMFVAVIRWPLIQTQLARLPKRFLKCGLGKCEWVVKVSRVYAMEQIKKEMEELKSSDKLVHTVTKLIMYQNNGKINQEIVYDLWQDNASARFKNVVFYPDGKVVQVNDGFNRYDWDEKNKTLNIEHYVNVPKGGMPKAGDQVRLLSEFHKILNHQSDINVERGKYDNQTVLVLGFYENQVQGDKGQTNTFYYEYYFDNQFRLIGKRVWRVDKDKKILTQEVRVEKYEVIDRNKANLDKIFKFELPKDKDLKIYEVYRRADNLEMVTPTPTFESNDNEVQGEVIVSVTPECKVMVEAGDKTLSFPTGFKAGSKCYQFLTTAVYKDFNLNKNYVAYEAVDENDNTKIMLVIVEDEKVINLVDLGKSWVFDMKFLPAGELVILYGDKMLNPTRQFIEGIKVSELMTDYPDNVDLVSNQFKRIKDYSNRLELPLVSNKQGSYELIKYEEGRIKVVVIGGKKGFEIRLKEFLP